MKQKELILSVMQANPGKWYLPQDFMRDPACFVGYEASARLSEIAREFPGNIESKREGRQMARRWVGQAKERGHEAVIEFVDGGVWKRKTVFFGEENERKAEKLALAEAKKLCLGAVTLMHKAEREIVTQTLV